VADRPALELDWMPSADGEPRAIVVLLHGGRERSAETNPQRRLAVVRMRAFGRPLRARLGDDVGVALVRFRSRGWDGPHGHPVVDVGLALDDLASRYGARPVVLVGHSMGGRAAVAGAAHRLVRGVVGLAPWLPPGEPVEPLRGRRFSVLHGTLDRTTSPRASAAFAAAAASVATAVRHERIRGGGHAMIARSATWYRRTAAAVSWVLTDA
jgi:pimeloyl-ACP methyl ester carboxylesterase